MKMVFKMAVVFSFWLALAGCSSAPRENIWDQIKIDDLARPNPASFDETINVTLLVFETEATYFGRLEGLWDLLSQERIDFQDKSRMERNACLAGFGHNQQWPEVVELLVDAQSHRAESTGLLLVPGEDYDTAILSVPHVTTSHYVDEQGSLEQIQLERGDLSLRLTARPGSSRGTARVAVMPVFARNVRPLPGMADQMPGGYEFDFLGVETELAVGDFLVIGPQVPVRGAQTLAGLMFSRQQYQRHLLITYVIACTATND